VTQPENRNKLVPVPGELSADLGEFWVPNPWLFSNYKKNLSSYERNRLFLNRGSLRFADLSHLSGADSEGDGRASVATDLNGDGMLDIVVRQVGGGPLLVFENRFPRQHYLTVTLRGTKSNRAGIGARLIAECNGQKQVREMFPGDTFMSQSPCEVHFGLGKATRVDRLTILWPSGTVQQMAEVAADRHIVIEEGDGTAPAIAQ